VQAGRDLPHALHDAERIEIVRSQRQEKLRIESRGNVRSLLRDVPKAAPVEDFLQRRGTRRGFFLHSDLDGTYIPE